MKVTGTGIPSDTFVIKINSQTDIVLSANVTIADDTALTFAFDGAILGSAGGENTHLLTSGESGLPEHKHTITDPGHQHSTNIKASSTSGSGQNNASSHNISAQTSNVNTSNVSTGITETNNIAAADASSAHNIIQPTLVLNYIIKQ